MKKTLNLRINEKFYGDKCVENLELIGNISVCTQKKTTYFQICDLNTFCTNLPRGNVLAVRKNLFFFHSFDKMT